MTEVTQHACMYWRGKWQPTPVFLPGESQGKGAWSAAVHGFAQSQTRLKWLNNSSSLQSNLVPEQCRPGKHRCHELGQTHCGPYTASTPHTHQWYLFAVFLPPHSTTEQVRLNKWPPSPACVRVAIRQWRDLQTDETKINKEAGAALEMTGETY